MGTKVSPELTDEQVLDRGVGFRVYVADGRTEPTYDMNPAIVIESSDEHSPYRMELRRGEAWAFARLLLKALAEW